MTTHQPTYAAMITISLPGTDKTATASVILAEGDVVVLPNRSKLLRDCTLADLEIFADNWEAEVWETYQAIKLVELDESEKVEVKVTRVEEGGDVALADWKRQAVWLPEKAEPAGANVAAEAIETTETTDKEDTEPAAETAVSASMDAGTEKVPTEEAETPKEAEPHAEVLEVIVAESEPVYEEREAIEPVPLVLPARPQVRVAGQRLPSYRSNRAAVDIFIEEPALRAAQVHALSSLSREVAGVLVGPQPEKQPDGRYHVFITDTIIAKHTVMQGASVTYTPESWRYVNDQLMERYPEETAVMVGWYHTHPGFGIFLSGMDQFIHQNFFTQKWHVALVLDPVARISGFFCWDQQKTHVNRYDFSWPNWAAQWEN